MLTFKYGVMNSSKSANLIMAAYSLAKQGKIILVLKPKIDTRSKQGLVESRVGLTYPCVEIQKDTKINELINNNINVILIDECNFLTKQQVQELRRIVDKTNIDIICYGLKNTYIDGELFEGSQALLYYADNIEEIKDNKMECVFCKNKAIMNLRIVNNQPIYNGESICIGDTKKNDDYYIPVCSKHYYDPILEENNKNNIKVKINDNNDEIYINDTLVSEFFLDNEEIVVNTLNALNISYERI